MIRAEDSLKLKLLSIISVALIGCSVLSAQAPTDLKVVSVEVVSLDSLAPTVQKHLWLPKPKPADIIKVTLSTDNDLFAFSQSISFVHLTAWPCQGWETFDDYTDESGAYPKTGSVKPIMSIADASYYFFFDDVAVKSNNEAYSYYDNLPPERKSSRPLLYQVYLKVRYDRYAGPLKPGMWPPGPSYDLKHDPENVCLQLFGSDLNLGVRTDSNKIVIPKEAIAASFAAKK